MVSNKWYKASKTNKEGYIQGEFDATGGTTYYFWWDGSMTDNQKTFNVHVYYGRTGNELVTPFGGFTGTSFSFKAKENGRVTVYVFKNDNIAIAYTTTNTRPK